MLERKMDAWLTDWKNRDHKPLILEGTRQTGKTTSVLHFAKTYDAYFLLDFRADLKATAVFGKNLYASTIETNVLNYHQAARPKGKVLLILDQVQRCPRAVQALKFLALESSWDIIAIHSTPEDYDPSVIFSWPVGYVEYQKMNGLDFEEFMMAIGITDMAVDLARKHLKEQTSLPLVLHNQMLEALHQYLLVGGMPKIVQDFVDNRDYRKVFDKQKELYQDTLNHFARYAPLSIGSKAIACYESIIPQLEKPNHKFQYKLVAKGGRSRSLEQAVLWLENTRFCTRVGHLRELGFSVFGNCDLWDFRLVPTEIGMLMGMLNDDVKYALLQEKDINREMWIESKPADSRLHLLKGAVFECLAADMLYKAGIKTLSFYKESNREMEFEFVLNSLYGSLPIEIKAGKPKSKSLDRMLAKMPELHGIKLGSSNLEVKGNKIMLPIYLLPFLNDLIPVW